tara:strand:+ start:133 stop:765 length:633 start_codon:yes stop_codon:yes gene_type:complete
MGVCVVRLERKPRGVRVVPLTRDLATRLREQAAAAINGDGGCSLKAMTTSCFASESCASGHSALQLDMLLASPHAYVAVADVAPDGTTQLAEDAFVGCVSAGPARGSMVTRLFPHQHSACEDALTLSNLCVADAYRGHGIGRKLVKAVLARDASRTYLLIARGGERHPDPDVAAAFAQRVPRLRKTYAKLQFRPVDECAQAVLLYCDDTC